MPEIEEIAASIRSNLDKKEIAREGAIKIAREIIRDCRSAITNFHRGERTDHIKRQGPPYLKLRKALEGFPDILYSGYMITAQQEIVEAEILLSINDNASLPAPEELQVSNEAYLLGLGDAIGEMRRKFLDRLMNDDIESAKGLLERMEQFFSIIISFDYPEALIPIRRKQDIARGLIDKTRGELVLAHQMSRLRKDLS